MNTLSTNSIQSILHSFKEFSSAAQKLTDSGTVFPVNVTGLNGSLHSYFLKEFAGASYAKWTRHPAIRQKQCRAKICRKRTDFPQAGTSSSSFRAKGKHLPSAQTLTPFLKRRRYSSCRPGERLHTVRQPPEQ